MQIAAAHVDQPAEIVIRASQARHLIAIQSPDIFTHTLPLMGQIVQVCQGLWRVRGTQPTGADRVALDVVFVDQVKDEVARLAGHLNHPLPVFIAEFLADHTGRVFEAHIDLTTIAPRRAPAWLLRLKKRDLNACLGQMERGGEARKSAAHDDNVGFGMPVKLREIRHAVGGGCPQAVSDDRAFVGDHGLA